MTSQDISESVLYVCCALAAIGMICCEVVKNQQEAVTERLAIEKGYCRETSFGQWKPCPPPPEAEKGK